MLAYDHSGPVLLTTFWRFPGFVKKKKKKNPGMIPVSDFSQKSPNDSGLRLFSKIPGIDGKHPGF